MKYIVMLLILHALLAHTVRADEFVETITELSARDALTIVDQTIYASNYNNGIVYKIEQDGTSSTVIEASQRGSAGIRFDDDGNMYVAMYNINSIIKLDSQGNESTFASGVSTPIALDWDNNQNLYVSSFSGANTVTRIDQDGVQTQLGGVSQLDNISSLCLDASGDIYVTSYNSGDIYRMTPSGEVSLFTSTNTIGLTFLQYDANENVFFAAVANDSLLRISANGSVETLISSSEPGVIDGPIETASIARSIGLAISADGKQVYFATDSHIRRIIFADPAVDQVRPYFTSDSSVTIEEDSELSFQFTFVDPNDDPLSLTLENLPEWLTFDSVDTITGTPGSNEAGQTYTVTAKLDDQIAVVSNQLNISVTQSTAPPPAPPAPQPTPTQPTGSSSGGSISSISILLLMLLLGHSKINKFRRAV